ncbi:nucleotidyltransferase domain-containing protein [Longimicrobium sp.]|uniref:nucleotidyltransferase domain-containing protein n=1 Tax=Longimicrobium sp. TaxID=2029185 RepID=UPI003B3A430F
MAELRKPATKSSLAALFPSMAMARLVIFFAVHPGARYHVRELSRLTGLSSASLQHELKRMAQIGALVREDERGRALYRADESHRSWYAWMVLLRASARPTDVLREALVDARGLQGAFVFGSTARGDTGPNSDVDVFLIGSREAQAEAGLRLGEAEFLIGREVDVVGYDTEQLAARIRSNNGFIHRVLSEPQEWVRGSLDLTNLLEAA